MQYTHGRSGSPFRNDRQNLRHRFRLRLRGKDSLAVQANSLIAAAARSSLTRTMSARISLNADIMANAVERTCVRLTWRW